MNPYLPIHIRNMNRGLVLELFLEHRVLTRSEIKKRTNLSFPTVMKIVDYMLSKGIISETDSPAGIHDGKLGRKGHILRLNTDAYSTVGIHFEGNYLLAGLVNLGHEVRERKTFPYSSFRGTSFPKKATNIISSIMTDTIQYFRSSHPETQIIGTGVALPAVIEAGTGRIIHWDLEIPVPFEELFVTFREIQDLPVYVENDMNAAALGEWLLRKEEKLQSLSYLALGTGLGGGIILDGEIWRGNSSFSGDFGGILTTLGCLESVKRLPPLRLEDQINIAAIQQKFGIDIRKGKPAPDEIKQKISDYVADYIVSFIYNLCFMMDMGNYVVAGVIPEFLGDTFYKRIDSIIEKIFTPKKLFPTVRVLPTINKDVGIVGAAAIAFRRGLPALLGDDG